MPLSGLRRDAEVGKVEALANLGAPLYTQGVAVRARSCDGGAGCAADSSIFCSVFTRCFGAAATIVIPSAPTKIDIDPKAGTVAIGNFAPSGNLDVFAELDNLISGIPQARARATFSSMPSSLSLTAGPFEFNRGDTTTLHAKYTASASPGNLTVTADALTSAGSFGEIRGRLAAVGLPATFDVSGTFGGNSELKIANSAATTSLSVQASATVQGSPASGLFQLTSIPATADIVAHGADKAAGFNYPGFSYSASASTLSGFAQIDASLSANVGTQLATAGAYFKFTSLGASTTAVYTSNTKQFVLTSKPSTASFQFGANIQIGDVPNQDFDKTLYSVAGNGLHIIGHFGARASHIDDIEVAATSVTQVRVQPGNAPFGLPDALGLLFPGFDGTYGTLSVSLSGIDINPDIAVGAKLARPALPDSHLGPYNIVPEHVTSINVHKYDDNGPGTLFHLDFGVACVKLKVNPEPNGTSTNGFTLTGSTGQQSVSLIDTNDSVPNILVDVLAADSSPFIKSNYDVDSDFGTC